VAVDLHRAVALRHVDEIRTRGRIEWPHGEGEEIADVTMARRLG
jgi:hypothetical protein